MSLTRQKIFNILYESGCIIDKNDSLQKSIQVVKDHYSVDMSHEIHSDLTTSPYKFLHKLREKWQQCNRALKRFLRINSTWLESNLIPSELETLLPSTCTSRNAANANTRSGRPCKDWQNLSQRSRQRKARELLKENEPHELLFAASHGSYKKDPNLKYVLKFILESPSNSSTNIRKLISKPDKPQSDFTGDEALSLMIDTDLTKQSYQTLRSTTKRKNVDIYPPYNHVREAKQKCYPGNIQVDEKSAKVPLQELLDHTALRLIEQEKDKVIETVEEVQEGQTLPLTLICKWGFDGASGHSQYKQKFSSPDISDESMFCTTFVPLQMKSPNDTCHLAESCTFLNTLL